MHATMPSSPTDHAPGADYHHAVSAFKRRLIEDTLQRMRGNRTHAARVLGLQRTYLLRLIRELRVDAPPPPPRGRGAAAPAVDGAASPVPAAGGPASSVASSPGSCLTGAPAAPSGGQARGAPASQVWNGRSAGYDDGARPPSPSVPARQPSSNGGGERRTALSYSPRPGLSPSRTRPVASPPGPGPGASRRLADGRPVSFDRRRRP